MRVLESRKVERLEKVTDSSTAYSPRSLGLFLELRVWPTVLSIMALLRDAEKRGL
jgi:hypothetical protein